MLVLLKHLPAHHQTQGALLGKRLHYCQSLLQKCLLISVPLATKTLMEGVSGRLLTTCTALYRVKKKLACASLLAQVSGSFPEWFCHIWIQQKKKDSETYFLLSWKAVGKESEKIDGLSESQLAKTTLKIQQLWLHLVFRIIFHSKAFNCIPLNILSLLIFFSLSFPI